MTEAERNELNERLRYKFYSIMGWTNKDGGWHRPYETSIKRFKRLKYRECYNFKVSDSVKHLL